MKKITINIILAFVLLLPFTIQAQISDIQNKIQKGEYSKAMQQIQEAYNGDTMDVERLAALYMYYIDIKNPQQDSLFAFVYASLYNKKQPQKDKRIQLDTYAKDLLLNVYRSKDVDRLNLYILHTENYPSLNKEAQRIRNQIAYEQVQEANTSEAYQYFVDNYPEAMQAEEARTILNQMLFSELMQANDIEKLKQFAQNTNSEKYKAQALKEIDKLSFNKALKLNTLEAYNEYISEFPDGDYIVVAKGKRDAAQYDKYVNEGRLSDLIYYLQNTTSSDKNYSLVLEKLKLLCYTNYSLAAMKVLDSLQADKEYLERFAKRYISDYNIADINRLLEYFPELKNQNYIIEAQTKAGQLQSLAKNKDLTLEDYKKNKTLFANLNAKETAKVFALFEEINSTLPKNKRLVFPLSNDVNYLNFINAKENEMDFILTEASYDAHSEDRPQMQHLGIEFTSTDAYYVTDSLIIFSAKSENGYDYYPQTKNADIFYCVYDNDQWQTPKLLPKIINTRHNESHPVLSKDLKTLWFSSDRGLNFGGMDVYVSYREDINDWNSWCSPILLGEDFNTQDDDYVLKVEDNLLVLSQDESMRKENNIYLEGKTELPFVFGKINSSNKVSLDNTRVNILNKKTLATINQVRTNPEGNFIFFAPKEDYLLSCKRSGYYSPLCENKEIMMYNIEDMVAKQVLVTIASCFEAKNPLEMSKRGQNELISLAKTFKKSPYILSMEIHQINDYKQQSALDISKKQAEIIKDFLIEQGMQEHMIVIRGVGTSKIAQGWENKSSIDITLISK